MDVMEILRQSGKELYRDELEMLTAELDTGEYTAEYVSACKALIKEIQNWSQKEAAKETAESIREKPRSVCDTAKPSSDSATRSTESGLPVPPQIPPEKIISSDLQRLRVAKDYKTAFRKYVKSSSIINEAFIVSHFSLFKEWEISAMLACIMFSEEYLENYFSVLDHRMIALYQQFSESFYMRHYAELDADTVLTKGVNLWRDKAQRSKQLEVFLRIKGVKI